LVTEPTVANRPAGRQLHLAAVRSPIGYAKCLVEKAECTLDATRRVLSSSRSVSRSYHVGRQNLSSLLSDFVQKWPRFRFLGSDGQSARWWPRSTSFTLDIEADMRIVAHLGAAGVAAAITISEINGNKFISPLNGTSVTGVEGLVIAKGPNGIWLRSTTPDDDDATSEAIYVFSSSVGRNLTVGDIVTLDGRVQEFRLVSVQVLGYGKKITCQTDRAPTTSSSQRSRRLEMWS
jgi:hypothetical protein